MRKLNESELREITGGYIERFGDVSDARLSDHGDAGTMKDGPQSDRAPGDVSDARFSDVSDTLTNAG